jgi:hypothetical protein
MYYNRDMISMKRNSLNLTGYLQIQPHHSGEQGQGLILNPEDLYDVLNDVALPTEAISSAQPVVQQQQISSEAAVRRKTVKAPPVVEVAKPRGKVS